jgi:hypothetical protein
MAIMNVYKDSIDVRRTGDEHRHVSVAFEKNIDGIDISVDTRENLVWFSLTKEDSKVLAEKLLEFVND